MASAFMQKFDGKDTVAQGLGDMATKAGGWVKDNRSTLGKVMMGAAAATAVMGLVEAASDNSNGSPMRFALGALALGAGALFLAKPGTLGAIGDAISGGLGMAKDFAHKTGITSAVGNATAGLGRTVERVGQGLGSLGMNMGMSPKPSAE